MAQFMIADDDLRIAFDFTKVDKEKRTVTGIATADNVDQEGDVIDYMASKNAFSTWVGNIREMHGPKAVGKKVQAREVLVRGSDGKEYRGFEVTAYISMGAEDTWQKVLDGTLTGFSVGGRIMEKAQEFHKGLDKMVTRIKKYLLTELSVVDNPANPLAQFTMIKSMGDGHLEATDVVMDIEVQKVYYCTVDEIANLDNETCGVCGNDMAEIGYIESTEGLEAQISKMITDFDLKKSGGNVDLQNKENNDSVTNMDELTTEQKKSVLTKFKEFLGFADEDVTKATEGTLLESTSTPTVTLNGFMLPNAATTGSYTIQFNDSTASNIVKAETAEVVAGEETIEKAKAHPFVDKNKDGKCDVCGQAKDSETHDPEDVADGGKDEATEKSNGGSEDMGFTLDELKVAIGEVVDTKLDAAKEEISKSVSEVTEKVDALTAEVETVKSSGAVKKSADVDAETETNTGETLKKSASFWGNSFVPQAVIEAYGYES